MKVSFFDSITDVIPQSYSTSWVDFAESLGPHETGYNDKLKVPAFCPAEWADGSTRTKRGVLRVHFGVLDLDKVTPEKIEVVHDHLRGLAHVFYTTWSHLKYQSTGGLWAARVLVPFSRPVDISEWKMFWPRLNSRLGGVGDPSCKDPSRLYFVPSAPPGSNGDSVLRIVEGEVLDVDKLLEAPQVVQENKQVVGLDDIRELAARLARKPSPKTRSLAKRMKKLAEGKPFAQEGERDNIVFRLCCFLIEEWPEADCTRLARLFEEPLKDMGRGSPTVEQVEEKLRRHQIQIQEEMTEQETEELKAKKRLLRAAFDGVRDTPYTEEELVDFASKAGVSRFDFQKRWIVQKDISFYLFKAGSYCAPVSKHELISAAERDLSPASSAGVSVWTTTKQGQIRLKTNQEMMTDYGTVARNVVVDLRAQYGHLDGDTITEAPCPLRDLEPEYSDEVNEWLYAMSGEVNYEKIQDWLAVVTELDEPCAAIYFEGAKNTGKTLFADAVSRLWTTTGPSRLEQALSNFNSSLLQCPLVLADEVLPKDFKGAGRTGELRQFIQERVRPLKRKFLPDTILRGCIRLVITANNKDLLATSEALTAHDIDAIVDRILYVHTSSKAAAYLQSIDTRPFVKEDVVARHALWLALNRKVTRQHRFIVTGADSSLHQNLTTSVGLRSAVCNWLVSYLLESSKMDTTKSLLVRVYDGKVHATTRGLAKYWQMYETNIDPPPSGAISKALSGLSEDRKKQLVAGDDKRTNYWVVKTANLITWAENNGYADFQTILDSLQE